MPTPNSREEQIDIAIANLVFSGLSIAQIEKIPSWLLENIEKNKPAFDKALHQELQKAREEERERIKALFPKLNPNSDSWGTNEMERILKAIDN